MKDFESDLMRMITDLHLNQKPQAKTADSELGGKDPYGYPYESFECFSMDPLGLPEAALNLYTEMQETFRYISRFNRHSPLFYKTAGKLEKLLSQLGSVCITGAVMEQQGRQGFGPIDGLTIDVLRSKTAFIFRKSCAAFMESIRAMHFNDDALDLSIRFFALDKRLQATEEKISLVRAGRIMVVLSAKEKNPETGPVVSHGPETAETEKPAAALASAGRALPVDKTVIRGSLRRCRMIRKSAESEQKPAEMAERPVEAVNDSAEMVKAPVEAGNVPVEMAEETDKVGYDPSEAAKAPVEAKEDPAETIKDSAETENQTSPLMEDPAQPEPVTEAFGLTAAGPLMNEIWGSGEKLSLEDDEAPLSCSAEDLLCRMRETAAALEYTEWPFPRLEYAKSPP